MAKKSDKTVTIDATPKKVHLPKLLPVALLAEHPNNSNVQSKHVFKELQESILQGGFDEALIVVPRKDGDGYYVVSGNHRFRAGKSVGYEELPCIVREDWDDVESEIQLVRRNYVRGQIDRAAFTDSVNRLSKDQSLALDVIMERMGFEDSDAFAEFYKQEKTREKRTAGEVASANSGAQQVKMIDDLGVIISAIFEKYGNTVPQSFLIFPTGGKNHIFVQVTPALKRSIDAITTKCIADGLDINTVLGGLLQIAIHNTAFFKVGNKVPEVVSAGSVTGDTNLTLIEK
jgi:ParB-like nuclease domain